jgi:hypothetical protein
MGLNIDIVFVLIRLERPTFGFVNQSEATRVRDVDGFALRPAVFHIDWMLGGFEEGSIFKLKT